MSSTPLTLADGNALQRAYYRWALPHYERMAPELRERVEALDRFLYSRDGAVLWLGGLCAVAALAGMLRALGLGWPAALGLALLIGLGLGFASLAVWLQPDRFIRQRGMRSLVIGMSIGLVSAQAGLAVGHMLRHGRVEPGALLGALERSGPTLVATTFGCALAIVILLWGVARISQREATWQLERSTLAAQRDAAARSAAEARLHGLQAQVQPHFVFNTLATLQHWVDRRDERAGPLLRELTAFLRRSTEHLLQTAVPLADEAQVVRHYLAVQQARLGARLHWSVEVDEALAAEPVPPGLLLTLVENALEHGLEPRIGGGALAVHARADGAGWCLQVDDEGAGPASGWREGVGLSNLRQRAAHAWGARAAFSLRPLPDGGTRAELRVGPPTPGAGAVPATDPSVPR